MLNHWALINQDLIDAGTDVSAPEIRYGRSWHWTRLRILGLLERPPIGMQQLLVEGNKTRVELLWGTRIQTALMSKPA